MKPGYKTTEFWLSVVAAAVGCLLASGVIPPDSEMDKVIGLIATALASMGYAVSRGMVKRGVPGGAPGRAGEPPALPRPENSVSGGAPATAGEAPALPN
jgi:hypothetical protein